MNQIYHMLNMVYITKNKMMDSEKYYYNKEGIISLQAYFSLYKVISMKIISINPAV